MKKLFYISLLLFTIQISLKAQNVYSTRLEYLPRIEFSKHNIRLTPEIAHYVDNIKTNIQSFLFRPQVSYIIKKKIELIAGLGYLYRFQNSNFVEMEIRPFITGAWNNHSTNKPATFAFNLRVEERSFIFADGQRSNNIRFRPLALIRANLPVWKPYKPFFSFYVEGMLTAINFNQNTQGLKTGFRFGFSPQKNLTTQIEYLLRTNLTDVPSFQHIFRIIISQNFKK